MNVLVTGGTGSFGQAFIRYLLERDCGRVVVFSRDELKQHEMRANGLTDERLRYFLGDVRDVDRLRLAMRGVDTVVHAAALKRVDSCEYNPDETYKTNVEGTRNIARAALDADVERVLMIGTDKAVDPINVYGRSKAMAESLMIDFNAYSGTAGPKFSCTRYGNVISSRGAVLPRFRLQHERGETLTVTDPSMSRFVLTLDQGVGFVSDCLGRMRGGEVFVPRLNTVTVGDIASAVSSTTPRIVGRCTGEKQHELLISAHEPELAALNGLPCPYGSNTDPSDRLTVEGFRAFAGLGILEAVA